MPSGLRKTTANHFEIYYEQPWGGVASSQNPIDIQPNQMVTAQGMASVNGELNTISVSATTGSTWMFHPHVTNAVACTMFTMLGYYYAIDQFGNMYQNIGTGAGFVYICTASDGPWTPASLTSIPTIAVQVINGTAYISVYVRNSIYSYNGNTTFALGSNYVGGLVLGVLDDYLLMLNCNQSAGGPSSSMISWSGPGEFTTWNPGTNQLAGYNELATVDDQLTGFLSFASVGVAISAKSLVELSPTGVGIGPFNFTTLWTSTIGQGCVYPFTITQYGQNGYLTTDSGVYTVSASAGFSDISGVAREAILASFQHPSGFPQGLTTQNPIAGNILLEFSNSNYSTPFYILAAPILSGVEAQFYNLWMYDLQGSGWYNAPFNLPALCNTQNGTALSLSTPNPVLNLGVLTSQPLLASPTTFGISYPPTTLLYYTLWDSVGSLYTTVATISATTRDNSFPTVAQEVTTLVFRQEEIKLGRKPTIRRILVRAYGTGTLALSISGVSFGTITLNGSLTASTYFSTNGTYTGETPQLTITSNNLDGAIVKVMLGGTYADGDID